MTKKNEINGLPEIVLGIFWILPFIHDWVFSITLPISVHFCNHFACIMFSLIWFGFAYDKNRKKKKESKKKKEKFMWVELIVLIVGIVLMNITICDANGTMSISTSFLTKATIEESTRMEAEDEIVPVPRPPCAETDDGRDYKSAGMITSGANVPDICMTSDLLRERFCLNVLNYTSEDVSCREEYGAGWVCQENECRYNPTVTPTPTPTPTPSPSPSITPTPTPPTNPEDSALECGNGEDDDGDQYIDCADAGCASICGEFDYSCAHISSMYDYPTCGGTCPTGEECVQYATVGSGEEGWCECMPSGNTSCHSSISCGGWCLEGDYCVSGVDGCFCSAFPCDDTDAGFNILLGGGCNEGAGWIMDYCSNDDTLIEYVCEDGGCVAHTVDCSDYNDNICVWTKDGSQCQVAGAP